MDIRIDIKKMQFSHKESIVKITLSVNGETDQECTAQVENFEATMLTSILRALDQPPPRPTCVIREEGPAGGF